MFIHKRPGVINFLKEMSELFILVIYTASTKNYADAIIKELDPDKSLISYRLYREDCLNINTKIMLKPVEVV